jgi:hypothetical protein
MSTGLSANLLKTYRQAPENWPVVERRLIAIRNLISIGIVFLFVAMDFGAAENWKNGSLTSLFPHVVIISFVFAVLFFSFRRAINQQRRTWASFELLVGSDFVARSMEGLAELEIRREELTAIRTFKQGLSLETASAQRNITIPNTLGDFPELRDRLSQWMAFSEYPQNKWMQSRYFVPGVLVVEMALLGVFFVSHGSLWEVLSGVPLVFGLLWCLIKVQMTDRLAPKTKRQMWFVLLPLVAIAARLVLAIINWQ